MKWLLTNYTGGSTSMVFCPGESKKILSFLLSQSSLEPLISLDLFSTKLYCFRARVHCYYCLYITFSANPVTRSEELRGGP